MRILVFLLLAIFTAGCQSQTKEKSANKIVGGPCQGCEAIHEYGTKKLTALDTLPGFLTTEPKLKITGTIYKKDGKTPAPNIVLYAYHTNRKGIYEKKGDEKGWATRHGFIRGWIKTGNDGKYTFYTFRPGAYPNGRAAEHVHLTVKEPDKNEYYIDDIMFSDDPHLTASERQRMQNRAGTGIVTLEKEEGILVARRDIVLGLNIPDYD